jgi:hypothetical protein
VIELSLLFFENTIDRAINQFQQCDGQQTSMKTVLAMDCLLDGFSLFIFSISSY